MVANKDQDHQRATHALRSQARNYAHKDDSRCSAAMRNVGGGNYQFSLVYTAKDGSERTVRVVDNYHSFKVEFHQEEFRFRDDSILTGPSILSSLMTAMIWAVICLLIVVLTYMVCM